MVVPSVPGDEQMALVLGADVTERRRAADALARVRGPFREKSEALERHNVALKVIMDQRRSDLEDRRRGAGGEHRAAGVPTMHRLATAFSDRPEGALVDVVMQTLNDDRRRAR